MWGYYGWGWVWMAVMMLLVWGGLIGLAILAVRAFVTPGRGDAALETLRRRFAAGEISQEEFERARRALGS